MGYFHDGMGWDVDRVCIGILLIWVGLHFLGVYSIGEWDKDGSFKSLIKSSPVLLF